MMRISRLIALVACMGCDGSSSDEATEQRDTGTETDAATTAGSAATSPMASDADETDDVEALVRQAVENWDRVLDINCDCLVESGTFETLDACVKPSASAPDWVPCGTMALAQYELERTLVAARCLRDELKMRGDCLARTECGSEEQLQCEMGAMQCASKDPEVLVTVLQACPDLGLLSRPLIPPDGATP